MTWKLHPFYFPTSVIFIDDEPNFLKHFSLLLDEELAFRVNKSAREALTLINSQRSSADSLCQYINTTILDNAEEQNYLDINLLHKHIYDPERFSWISVIVVDYAMPEMDGLEFCRQLKDKEIKRILLTGKADEKKAVEAFNEGLIDRFFLKDTVDISTKINQAISEMQHSYFQALGDRILITFTKKLSTLFDDPTFQENVTRLQAENRWVECYLWDQPQGVMLLDADGHASFLFATSKEELQTHYDIVEAEKGPPELLEMLAKREYMPWFPTTDGYYTSECTHWQENLHPVDFFHSSDEFYLCALVSPSPQELLDVSIVLPYHDYLEKMDTELISRAV